MGETSMKVDMIATARDVQWSADTFLGFGNVKLVAPAKVNLFLGVGERRPDGYHDVLNVMQATALHDVLYMNSVPVEQGSADARYMEAAKVAEATKAAGPLGTAEATGAADAANAEETVRTICELPGYLAVGGPESNLLVMIDCADKGGVGSLDVPAKDNLVFKAVHALACEIGYAHIRKVSVRLEKNIPYQGGLGGGSSDAAAALLGAAKLWGVSPDDPAIERVARKLGSDVAFFLHGGCSLLEGAGDVFVRSLEPRKDAILLVKPQGGVSTAQAYNRFDENPVAVPKLLVDQVKSAEKASEISPYNNLAPAAEGLLPELVDIRIWAGEQPGVQDVLLCGSGATTCVIVDSFSTACNLAAAAQLKGWWARATMFSSLKAAIRSK